ncbi:hypothetical protein [Planomicrobium sp. CPCC 101079]|uniref:hypothetical protein n=1 Tax=Planomicrobium sp. CPCC 101079 TaxID=2599618 RepID=UPI0011B79BDB|nr:hypothetical protein [Planomicrobium sp. CPCC 101079]TWT08962.1 hypothetical protein FQV28_04820 [Planomicrobium sp. CPCC 101079]
MNRIQNDKGYALLLVMLLVVLFSILGLGLLALNMNAATQFTTKEEQVQARHQAEMGVLHYKAQLEKIVETNKINKNLSCTDLKKAIVNISNNENASYSITNENIDCVSANKSITVSINSVGKYRERDDQIEAEFVVNQLGANSGTGGTGTGSGAIPVPSDYNDSVKVVESDFKFLNGSYSPAQSSMHIKGDATVQSGNSKGGNDILIQRNFFVDGNIDFKNHACLAVRGNLIVKGNVSATNKVYIFVYGNAYFNSYTYTSSNNEIFVTGKVFVNGIEKPNKYGPVPSGKVYVYGNGNKSCPLPGSGNPGTSQFSWELGDEMNVDYFTD